MKNKEYWKQKDADTWDAGYERAINATKACIQSTINIIEDKESVGNLTAIFVMNRILYDLDYIAVSQNLEDFRKENAGLTLEQLKEKYKKK